MDLLDAGCVVCRSPGRDALCRRCVDRTDPPPTVSVRDIGPVPALFAYDGHGAAIVQALKYRDGRRLVGPLADRLADVVDQPPAAVTWLPTSGRRRRERGFDQAELVARALARRLGVPPLAVLARAPGPAVTGLDRAGRADSVRFTPRRDLGRNRRRRHRPGPLLVVDDVCTTGSTLRAARRAMTAGGHGAPAFVVVARTP